MTLPNFAFFKGRIVPYSEAKIGVLTHTFNYGTGVFGGLRAYWNTDEEQLLIFRPLDHYRRFIDSAKLLLMELPYSEAELVQFTIELLKVVALSLRKLGQWPPGIQMGLQSPSQIQGCL